MEQHIQNSRFLVLTGHLNDYPLSDLVGILRHQHKTGRLLIEYPNGPASFYFKDGELVDAQLDKLNGLQALCVALAQPASSFNFNPLIRPTRRSIENSLQKAVSELLGCWSENDYEIEQLPAAKATPMSLPAADSMAVHEQVTPEALAMAPLALPAPPRRVSEPLLATGAAGLLLLGLSTLITVTGGLRRNVSSANVSNAVAAESKVLATNGNGGSKTNPAEAETRTDSRVGRQTGKGREVARASQHSARQKNRHSSTDNAEAAPANSIPTPITAKSDQDQRKNETVSDTQSVKVLLQIEGGRVARASIANPRSGMEAYEAMALRIARQRRFASSNTSQETVTIKVGQPK